MKWVPTLVLALGCGPGLPPCGEGEFIAFATDFEDYSRWHRIELDPGDLELGPGPRVVYVNALPQRASTEFPKCTMLLKTTERGPDPTTWMAMGMVKRGGDYNADGAVGWEWFDFVLSPEGVPAIDWRGPVPPEGKGYTLGSEDDPDAVSDCNTCHLAAEANDFVMSVDLGDP